MSAHRRAELLRPQSRGANYSSRIVINVDPGRLAAAPAAHEGADRSRSARVVHRLASSARLPPQRTRPASPSRSTNSSRCPPRLCTSRSPSTQPRRPRLAHTCQRLARLRTARTRLSLSTNGVINHVGSAWGYQKRQPSLRETPSSRGFFIATAPALILPALRQQRGAPQKKSDALSAANTLRNGTSAPRRSGSRRCSRPRSRRAECTCS